MPSVYFDSAHQTLPISNGAVVVRINKYGSDALNVTVTSKDDTAVGMCLCICVCIAIKLLFISLIAGIDYEAVSQTVSFGRGADVKTISVTILQSCIGFFELTLESSVCTNDIIKTTMVTVKREYEATDKLTLHVSLI